MCRRVFYLVTNGFCLGMRLGFLLSPWNWYKQANNTESSDHIFDTTLTLLPRLYLTLAKGNYIWLSWCWVFLALSVGNACWKVERWSNIQTNKQIQVIFRLGRDSDISQADATICSAFTIYFMLGKSICVKVCLKKRPEMGLETGMWKIIHECLRAAPQTPDPLRSVSILLL